jgi:hypothetical protein
MMFELKLSEQGRVVVKAPRFQLSEKTKREIEAIEHRHRQAMATAHLYWFD